MECTDVVTTERTVESGHYSGQGHGTGTSNSRVTDEYGNTMGYVHGNSTSSTKVTGMSSSVRDTTSVEHRWNEGCKARSRRISTRLTQIITTYDLLYTEYRKQAIAEEQLLKIVQRDPRLPTPVERQKGATVNLLEW